MYQLQTRENRAPANNFDRPMLSCTIASYRVSFASSQLEHPIVWYSETEMIAVNVVVKVIELTWIHLQIDAQVDRQTDRQMDGQVQDNYVVHGIETCHTHPLILQYHRSPHLHLPHPSAKQIHHGYCSDATMGAMASQITSLTIVYSTVYSGANQRKYQSPAPLAFVPFNSPHRWPVTREMFPFGHYDDVIMTMLASQITSLTVVYSIVYSGVNQRKHQSSASLAFVREIHWGPVNFPHKWPVTRKMFPFDDVIMVSSWYVQETHDLLVCDHMKQSIRQKQTQSMFLAFLHKMWQQVSVVTARLVHVWSRDNL